jgi:hypothetical protein
MSYNQILIFLTNERTNDALRSTPMGRLQQIYPDKERQPRILRHWINR